MTEDLQRAETRPIAVVEREGFVESRHEGIVAMVAPDGTLLATVGDVDAPMLARSALKPFFAATLAERLALTEQELALASGSIDGTAEQVAVARGMADRLGVGETALRCAPRRTRWVDAATAFAAICVGKHVALAAAAALVDDDRPYTDPAHPVQVELRAAIERHTGVTSTATVTDGCGAPVYATSVAGLAFAARGLAGQGALGAVGAAMRAHPWLVEAPGGIDTVLMERLGCTAKFGAEATEVLVAPDGTTVVVKVADGARRAAAPVAVALLEQVGAVPSGSLDTLTEELGLAVHGGGRVVGRVRSLV